MLARRVRPVDFAQVAPDGAAGGNFTFSDFPDCSQFVLIGTAGCVGGELEVTPSVTTVTGVAWLRLPYDLTTVHDMAMQLRVRIVVGSPASADGMAVIFQADPRGTGALGVGPCSRRPKISRGSAPPPISGSPAPRAACSSSSTSCRGRS